MVENNEQGRRARKYFIEVEKRYNESRVPLAAPKIMDEFQKVERLLQMLKLGLRENILNETSEYALRSQAAEILLGHPILLPQPVGKQQSSTDSEPEIPSHKRYEAPQWVKEGFAAKTIARMAQCSATRVGILASKYDLRTPEYGGWYEYTHNGQSRQIFIYNENGKKILLGLLNGSLTDIRDEIEE